MASVLKNLEQQENLNRITQELANFFENKDNVQFKTDLDNKKIRGIVRTEYKDHLYRTIFKVDMKFKKKFTEPTKEHLVSFRRKGRTEFFDALRSLIGFEQKQRSGIKGLLGIP